MSREKIIYFGQKIKQAGLVQGTGGNLSCIADSQHRTFWITPSGMDYDQLTTNDICLLDQSLVQRDGNRKPSVESRLHRDIYHARADVLAIIHTHSIYACSMATARVALPVIEAGLALIGNPVEVADFAETGSEALSAATINALRQNQAVLLANHGLVAVGRSLEAAFEASQLVEIAAQKFIFASSLGRVFEIPQDSIPRIAEFQSSRYGQGKTQPPPSPTA